MKVFRAIKNFINYLHFRLFLRKKYDIKLLRQHFDYYKKYSKGWTYARYCYISNKKMDKNLDAKIPVSPLNHVLYFRNLHFDISDYKNLQGCGKYFQCVGHIFIGKGSFIANNVALITANHDFADLTKHQEPKDIIIGKGCWIGINSTILPGVRLGDHTIVGAGSVVTKSFDDGHVVVAGNPAKIIRKLD